MPSPSRPIADLTALAAHLGAQQAWLAALKPTEVTGLIGDTGNPMAWAVAVGQARGGRTATVMESRPEVTGRVWTALDLPSAEASP